MAATRAPDRWPVIRQEWRHLLFVHWVVDAGAVQRLLPPGLDVDTFDGQAYVGLVPFTVRGTRPPLLPPLPVVSRFHEVNLRTYVHRGGREPGVWFFSLDATSRATVIGARAWFRLPYHFARIRMELEPGVQVGFECSRPGPKPAGCSLRYRPAGPVRMAEPGSLEYFLAERYILYASDGDGLRQGRVAHEPYPLQPGEVDGMQETLSAAASVPATRGDRLVHYASGVSVRIYAPVQLGDGGAASAAGGGTSSASR
jgi:uncharacterized protein YqjF (DUF2071 family)